MGQTHMVEMDRVRGTMEGNKPLQDSECGKLLSGLKFKANVPINS